MKKNIFNKNEYLKLTEVEEYIIDKINTKPEIILSSDIKKIASEYGVSTSSLSRLAKKIGFNNLASLRMHISNEIIKISNYLNTTTTLNEAAKDVHSYSIYSINETIINKNFEIVDKFISRIDSENDKIICFGIESSFLSPLELATNLQKIGLDAHALNVIDTLISFIVSSKNTKLIIFSDSMRYKIFRKIIDLVGEENTLVITGNASFLSKNTFVYEALKVNFEKDELAAKYVQLAIADYIFLRLSIKNNFPEKNEKAKKILSSI